MKSILVIEGRRTIGGGQIVTKKICDSLSKEYCVSVFIPGDSSTPVAKYLSNVKQHYYKLKEYGRGKKTPIDYLRFAYNLVVTFISLFRLLKREHFDLIYIQHQNILPEVVLVNKFFKIPCVSHLHVYYADGFARKLVNKCLMDSNIKKVVGVSHYTLSKLNPSVKEKSDILYNSVTYNKSSDDDSWHNQVAIVGDVIPNKGHKILLDALKKMDEVYTLHIIGNVVSPEFLNILNVDCEKVRLVSTGMISNVPDYLKSHKVSLVVIPSIAPFETFSLAMVEAWSMGIPTLATNDFGMKEIVETFVPSHANELLFTKGDSIELSRKIDFLSRESSLRKDLCVKLKRVAEDQLNEDVFEYNVLKLVKDIF